MAKDQEPKEAVKNNSMTIDKYLDMAYPAMSKSMRSIFLSKHSKLIKPENEWAAIVKAEFARRIQ